MVGSIDWCTVLSKNPDKRKYLLQILPIEKGLKVLFVVHSRLNKQMLSPFATYNVLSLVITMPSSFGLAPQVLIYVQP